MDKKKTKQKTIERLTVKILCSHANLSEGGKVEHWLDKELKLAKDHLSFESVTSLSELDADADIYIVHDFNWGVFDSLAFFTRVREKNQAAAFVLSFEAGSSLAALDTHCGVFRLRLFKSMLGCVIDDIRVWREFQQKWRYDVALSFKGSQRNKAELLYTKLKQLGVRTFFDQDFEWTIWGEQGTLPKKYRGARHVIILYSDDYLTSIHTKAELDEALLSHWFTRSTILGIQTEDGGSIPEVLSKFLYFREWKVGAESLARGFLKKLEYSIFHSEESYEHDLYVSYKRDDVDVASKFIDALKQRGLRVFTDQDVKLGEDFNLHLRMGFDNSSDFLFLVGKRSADPKGWQMREFGWAKQRLGLAADSFCVLPIILPDVDEGKVRELLGDIRWESLKDTTKLEPIVKKLVDRSDRTR